MIRTLNYYGYSRETYQKCLGLIGETDLHHARLLNVWFTVLSLVVFFLVQGSYLTVLAGSPMAYFCFFVIAMVWNAAVFTVKKHAGLFVRAMVLFNILLLFSFAHYSSIVQPYMSATMYPVIMVVVALSYIDTFFNIAFLLVVGSVIFGWSSYIYKPVSITYVDIYNVVVFLTLALVLHYSFQRKRLSRFVTYYENISIQHNLEVRSSFDALTSLLNRGRFFTMASEILRNSHEDYIALCLFDLDGFKQINDKLGHQMGDKAIQLAGENLLTGFGIDFGEKWSFEERAVSEKLSFAGRLGGDEFIVFLRGRKDRAEILEETSRLLAALAGVRAGELKGIYSSVGIAEISASDYDIDLAYSRADEALYKSKEAGKHTVTFSEVNENEI